MTLVTSLIIKNKDIKYGYIIHINKANFKIKGKMNEGKRYWNL